MPAACLACPSLLQFKHPLVGGIRSLQLDCQCEIRPLAQAVAHSVLCPCHRAPASWAGAGAAPTCAISGAALDRSRCGRDDRTVQLGAHPGGALHMKNPVNIANLVGSGWGGDGGGGGAAPATLNVIARIKVGATSGGCCWAQHTRAGVWIWLARAAPSGTVIDPVTHPHAARVPAAG